jgi:hypothetical protein
MDPIVDPLIPGQIEEVGVAGPDQEMRGAHPESLCSTRVEAVDSV